MGDLRCHVNNGEVHIHDDGRTLKFYMGADDFKKEVNDALDSLRRTDGVIPIKGKGTTELFIVSKDGDFSMFLHGGADCVHDLKSFVNTI